MTAEECEEYGMTSTCDDMDPVDPGWLGKCLTELDEDDISTTDLTGHTFALATFGLYSDSACTTVTEISEWTDLTSGDNCVVPVPEGNEEDWVLWCNGDEVLIEIHRGYEEDGAGSLGNCDGTHASNGYIATDLCVPYPDPSRGEYMMFTCSGSNFLM